MLALLKKLFSSKSKDQAVEVESVSTVAVVPPSTVVEVQDFPAKAPAKKAPAKKTVAKKPAGEKKPAVKAKSVKAKKKVS
jgi:hypothetical protein